MSGKELKNELKIEKINLLKIFKRISIDFGELEFEQAMRNSEPNIFDGREF